MLVLSRKQGEYIQIGDDIRVYVAAVGSDRKVKLAIDAPPNIQITRPDMKVKVPK